MAVSVFDAAAFGMVAGITSYGKDLYLIVKLNAHGEGYKVLRLDRKLQNVKGGVYQMAASINDRLIALY